MYLYKKNIILVPVDYDGVSTTKGILSFDCYPDKTDCNLRIYNFKSNDNLILGVAVNNRLNKIKIDNSKLNGQNFQLNQNIKNSDNVSVVLVKLTSNSYEVLLWGSNELNASWQSTLEFMLGDHFNNGKNNVENIIQNYQCNDIQKTEIVAEQNKIDESSFAQVHNVNCDNSYFGDNRTTQNIEQKNNENIVDEGRVLFDTTEILKDKSIEDFLEDVASLQEDLEDEFDGNTITNGGNDVLNEHSFYDRISHQVEKMFMSNPQEKLLDEIIPNSKFCRVEFDDKTGHYVFGVVYEQSRPKYLCYGVPAKKDSKPPRELAEFYQWLPIDVQDDNGNGYYMMYQEAETGNNISVEVI